MTIKGKTKVGWVQIRLVRRNHESGQDGPAIF